MPSFVKSVTFDCSSALLLAGFWAAALGSNVDEDSTDERAWVEPAGWGGPNLWFQRVPEGKTAKNRQHFDLTPAAGSDQQTEVERLISLGAERIDIGQGAVSWVVMADPDGNEFCVLARRE